MSWGLVSTVIINLVYLYKGIDLSHTKNIKKINIRINENSYIKKKWSRQLDNTGFLTKLIILSGLGLAEIRWTLHFFLLT